MITLVKERLSTLGVPCAVYSGQYEVKENLNNFSA
jgi:hypothetical protein